MLIQFFPVPPQILVLYGALISSSHGVYLLPHDGELRRPPWCRLTLYRFPPLLSVLERSFCRLRSWSLDIFLMLFLCPCLVLLPCIGTHLVFRILQVRSFVQWKFSRTSYIPPYLLRFLSRGVCVCMLLLCFSTRKAIIWWSEKLSCSLHCHSFARVTILVSVSVKSTLLFPLLDSKFVSRLSSLIMCSLFSMTKSFSSLPLLFAITSCHVFDLA